MHVKANSIFLGALFSLLTPSLFAQIDPPAKDPAGMQLGELVTDSITLMQQEKWDLALKYCEQAIKDGGNGALNQWGPLFGTIYYRKGICEMKLKKWADAAKSFEICYRDFPNKKSAMNENEYQNLALLRWADAAMELGEWKEALELMDKFIKEKLEPRDRFSREDLIKKRLKCYEGLGLEMGKDEVGKALEEMEAKVKNH